MYPGEYNRRLCRAPVSVSNSSVLHLRLPTPTRSVTHVVLIDYCYRRNTHGELLYSETLELFYICAGDIVYTRYEFPSDGERPGTE